MTLDAEIRRRHYHLRWFGKYMLMALVCFSSSLYAWPTRGGLLLLCMGCVFAGLAGRERKRMLGVTRDGGGE